MPTEQKLLEIIALQADIAKQGLDLAGIMALATERCLDLVGADGAAIELAEDQDMVYRATSGNAHNQIGLRVKRISSLSGLAVRTGETLICTDSEIDSRVDLEACRKVGLRSMICMPLRHGSSAIGVLKAMSAQPGKFGPAESVILNLLSEVIGAALHFATKFSSDDLFHQATHDGLTGLANRSLFMDRLRLLTTQRSRDPKTMGVLMIDMNGLKPINDNFGHRAGDAVISAFAQRLKHSARTTDTVARLGGDEFGVILSPMDGMGGIDTAIDRIHQDTAAPILFEGREFRVSGSIGAASFPQDATQVDHLIELADQRMYQRKRQHHLSRQN